MSVLVYALLIICSVSSLWSDAFFVPMHQVHPGQTRYSSAGVDYGVLMFIERGYLALQPTSSGYHMRFDGGQSLLPLEAALPVVLSDFGYVLIDGHHTYLTAQMVGASTIPVELVADFTQLSEADLWEVLEARGWAYLITIEGERQYPPRSFEALTDDPNRALATYISVTLPIEGSLEGARGAEYPVWIQIKSTTPFIELRIADALRRGGVVYDYAYGACPPREMVEAARRVLVDANLDGLWLVPARIHCLDLAQVLPSAA